LDLSIGSNLAEDEHKIGYYGLSANKYETIILVCIELGKEKEAFDFVQRAKSKATIDLMSTSRVLSNIANVHETNKELQNLLKEEESLLQRKKALQLKSIIKRHHPQSEIPYPISNNITSKSLTQQQEYTFDQVLYKLDKIYDQIEKIDPGYVTLKRPMSITLESTIEKLNLLNVVNTEQLKSKITLVEYFITDSGLFIFCIIEAQLYVKHINELTKTKLHEYIQFHDKYIRNYHYYKENGNILQDLSQYLIEPVKDILVQADSIIFISHSSLHYIPIHALELNGQPLIMSHKISYLPTAGLLQFIDRGNKQRANKLKSCNAFGVALSLPKEQDFLEEAK